MSFGNFEGKTKDFQEVYKLNEQFEGFTFARGFLWFGGTSPCYLSALDICLVEGRGPTTFFLSFYRNGIGSLCYPPCGWRHYPSPWMALCLLYLW